MASDDKAEEWQAKYQAANTLQWLTQDGIVQALTAPRSAETSEERRKHKKREEKQKRTGKWPGRWRACPFSAYVQVLCT
jgi:hypothetical protein